MHNPARWAVYSHVPEEGVNQQAQQPQPAPLDAEGVTGEEMLPVLVQIGASTNAGTSALEFLENRRRQLGKEWQRVAWLSPTEGQPPQAGGALLPCWHGQLR